MQATYVVWERGGWGDDGLGATTALLGEECGGYIVVDVVVI